MTAIPQQFLFTGISGLGVKRSLEKLAEFVRTRHGLPQNRGPRVLSLEGIVTVLAEPHVLEFDLTSQRADEFVGALVLPKPLLRQLWLEAHRRLLDEATQAISEGRDVYIHFHASWFHRQNEEFFTAVNAQELLAHGSRLLVTLTDDIYDIRARLVEDARLLRDELPDRAGARECVGQAVDHLRTILRWREIEFLLSESIAQVVAPGDHVVLAVKHPIQAAFSLLYETTKPRIYLSHPITEPRRLLASSDRGREQEGERCMAEVEELARALRERVTLFEPTAIDELRLMAGPAPVLTDRWVPFGSEASVLWVAPQTDVDAHAFDLHKASGELPAQWDQSVVDRLNGLRDAIQEQVNARDHKLVEQCHGLAVWRPLYRGNPSRGVKEELNYFGQLFRVGARTVLAIVYCPEFDLQMFSDWSLGNLIRSWLDRGIILVSPAAAERLHTAAETGELRRQLEPQRTLARGLESALREVNGRLLPPADYRAREGHALGNLPAQIYDSWLASEAEPAIESNIRTPPYLVDFEQANPGLRVIRERLDPLVFANRLVESTVERLKENGEYANAPL